MMNPSYSRRQDDQYYVHHQDEASETGREEGTDTKPNRTPSNGWRVFSSRRRNQNLSHHRYMMMNSFSYRRDRARKRLIFLQTYKLGKSVKKMECSYHHQYQKKLKKFAGKVKSAAASVLAFIRGGQWRACNGGSAVRASSPTRVIKCC